MGPKAVVECEVMLFFIFLFVLKYDGGVVFHVYAAQAT
jgi:hypothetical protein